MIHEPQAIGQLKALKFFDDFKDDEASNTQPIKKMFEKSMSKYFETNQINNTDAFKELALACPELENVRHELASLCRKETQLLPKTRLTIDLDGKYCLTSYNQPFLLFDTQDNTRILAISNGYIGNIYSMAWRRNI